MELTPQFAAESVGELYFEVRQLRLRVAELEQKLEQKLAAAHPPPSGVMELSADATVDDVSAALLRARIKHDYELS